MASLLVLAPLLVLVAACSGAGDRTPGPAVSATPTPALSSSPVTVASPVVGQLVRLDSSGLTKVAGFRLRTDDGAELEFRIGILDNGAEFPPGHLAEHMALGTPIRVFFRDEGGERVVYRLEDAG
jgi:hypothetical protein